MGIRPSVWFDCDQNCVDESEGESDMEEPELSDDKQEKFMNTYTEVLNEELRSTTLRKSFVRAKDQSLNKDEVNS